jgi:pilus assembly protein CpaE
MESQPIAAIPFDSKIFGMAANNGQMIAELSKMHRTTRIFRHMGEVLTGRGDNKKPQGSLLSPIIRKLQEKLAPRRAARAAAKQ